MIKKLFKSPKLYISLIIATLISAAILYLADTIIFPAYTNYNEGITTPDVTRMHIDNAAELLTNRGLRFEVIDRRANAAYPVNYIIDQNPSAGQLVKPNRKIYLKVNIENRPTVNVPELTNLSLRNARIQLVNYGLQIGSISYKSSRYKNTVLAQSIDAGDEVEKGSTVNLVISDGLGVKMITVPELVGKSLTEAQRLIITSGLRIGTYEYVANKNVPVNTVLAISPADKPTLLEGTEIDLIIAEDPNFNEIDEKFSINDSTKNLPSPNN
jgi:beta-lactam-binding protein with PASTA domain